MLTNTCTEINLELNAINRQKVISENATIVSNLDILLKTAENYQKRNDRLNALNVIKLAIINEIAHTLLQPGSARNLLYMIQGNPTLIGSPHPQSPDPLLKIFPLPISYVQIQQMTQWTLT